MADKPVNTIAGPFDRARADRLRGTLKEADDSGMGRDEVTMFEGQELLISFGQYLLEYVDSAMAQKGHNGL